MRFQDGDLVRVREWDDMANEFGIDIDGDIYIPDDDVYFTKLMREFCGQEFEIVAIHTDDDEIQTLYGHPWVKFDITGRMVELVEEEQTELQSLYGFISSFGKV